LKTNRCELAFEPARYKTGFADIKM